MQSAEAKQNFLPFLKQNAAKLSLLLLLTIVVVFLGRKAKEQVEPGLPELVPRASVFNVRASGLSGIRELMLLCKLDVQVWTLPYRLLKGKGNCLLIIEPRAEFQAYECEQIISWVENGNTLLYVDSIGPSIALAKVLKIKTVSAKPSENVKLAIPKEDIQNHYLDYVSSIEVDATGSRISGGELIIGDKQGAFLVRCPLGKGQVIAGVLPNFLANRNFSDKSAWSNMQLVVNICRLSGGSILFDERCHGFTNSENVFVYILKTPFGFACLQIILVLILAILSCLHLFGGVRKLAEPKSKQPKFIEAISSLLLRAKANKAAVSVIAQDTYRYAKHSGVSLDEADWQYLRSAQQLAMVDSKLLKEQVAECDKIRKKIEAIKKKDR